MKEHEYKNLLTLYNSQGQNNQIHFLKEYNRVFTETEHWLAIYNCKYPGVITLFAKDYFEVKSNMPLESTLDLNELLINNRLSFKKEWTHDWEDRTIRRYHCHIDLQNNYNIVKNEKE